MLVHGGEGVYYDNVATTILQQDSNPRGSLSHLLKNQNISVSSDDTTPIPADHGTNQGAPRKTMLHLGGAHGSSNPNGHGGSNASSSKEPEWVGDGTGKHHIHHDVEGGVCIGDTLQQQAHKTGGQRVVKMEDMYRTQLTNKTGLSSPPFFPLQWCNFMYDDNDG